MSITIYDAATGEIKAVRSGPSLAALIALADGQPFIEGAFPPMFFTVDPATGEPVAKP